MGSLLVITGPPGSGKSTLAALVAARSTRSVLVEGDAFFSFLAEGQIPPWLAASDDQNRVVVEATSKMHREFASSLIEPRHIIDSGGHSPETLADAVETQRVKGLLRVSA